MNRRMRTYYYAVFGAIGGLFGWQISNLLGLSFVSNLYLSEVIVGALVGLSIGLLIGITEGVLTRNLVQIGKSGLFSGLLGLGAGAIGLPLSEFLFQSVGAGVFGRAVGWGIFGMLIGLAEGVVGRSQIWKGMFGGLLGGAVGGILLEGLQRILKASMFGKALGLILLGASAGAFISLIVVLLSRAWLQVTSGKLKGTEFILDKFMRAKGPAIAIGSSALKSEIVLPDPDIAPQHAMLTGDGSHFTIKDMSLSGTYINKKRIERTELVNNSLIRMGNTEMVYHEKR
ncbi:MAG TPA: FHA domain-containing protein [Anaerolineales bacterium]|nr:FHA domain-containing protein [Anaerolineales bacterium]